MHAPAPRSLYVRSGILGTGIEQSTSHSVLKYTSLYDQEACIGVMSILAAEGWCACGVH